MDEKKGIDRGITGDELEKQIREELGEKNSENIEDQEKTVEVASESVEINEEEKNEQELSSQIDNIEKRFDFVEKSIAEIGGEEEIKKVLGNMSEEQKSALQVKIEEQKKIIAKQIKNLEQGDIESSIDELYELATGFLSAPSIILEDKDISGYPISIEEKIASPLLFTMGAVLIPVIGPLKGIQTVMRKIKLSMGQRKLKKMENFNK